MMEKYNWLAKSGMRITYCFQLIELCVSLGFPSIAGMKNSSQKMLLHDLKKIEPRNRK